MLQMGLGQSLHPFGQFFWHGQLSSSGIYWHSEEIPWRSERCPWIPNLDIRHRLASNPFRKDNYHCNLWYIGIRNCYTQRYIQILMRSPWIILTLALLNQWQKNFIKVRPASDRRACRKFDLTVSIIVLRYFSLRGYHEMPQKPGSPV